MEGVGAGPSGQVFDFAKSTSQTGHRTRIRSSDIVNSPGIWPNELIVTIISSVDTSTDAKSDSQVEFIVAVTTGDIASDLTSCPEGKRIRTSATSQVFDVSETTGNTRYRTRIQSGDIVSSPSIRPDELITTIISSVKAPTDTKSDSQVEFIVAITTGDIASDLTNCFKGKRIRTGATSQVFDVGEAAGNTRYRTRIRSRDIVSSPSIWPDELITTIISSVKAPTDTKSDSQVEFIVAITTGDIASDLTNCFKGKRIRTGATSQVFDVGEAITNAGHRTFIESGDDNLSGHAIVGHQSVFRYTSPPIDPSRQRTTVELKLIGTGATGQVFDFAKSTSQTGHRTRIIGGHHKGGCHRIVGNQHVVITIPTTNNTAR